MRHSLLLCAALAALTACGDPLAGVERVSETGLEIEDPSQTRGVAAAPEESGETVGLFSGLFARRAPSAPETAPEAVSADSPTVAEASAEQQSEGTADTALVEAAPALTEEPSEPRGLFARIFNPDLATPESATSQTATAETDTALSADPAPETDATELAEAEAAPTEAKPARKGLFGGLFRNTNTAENDTTDVASLSPDTVPSAQVGTTRTGGLFAPRTSVAAPRNGPDSADVAPGTRLAFGQIARVCDASDLGARVEKAARFSLYDSAPGSTGPRTFYVTGFADGCPRQFTAALAMFGDPVMHETLRYGRPSEKYPYSTTDKAYEKVKSVVCGASRRKPCGSKIGTLSRNTVFISTYERFSDNGRWADILLHDGAVLAAALKDL